MYICRQASICAYMNSQEVRSEINFIDKPYINTSGREFPKTVLIVLYDHGGRILETKDYGFLSTETIYDRIFEKGDLNFDECYIDNFSLNAYRRAHLIGKRAEVELHNFSARNALFTSNFEICFSYSTFIGDTVSFANTRFINGVLRFYKAKFKCAKLSFNSASLEVPEVDFSSMQVYDAEVNFKNATFADGLKRFQDTHFGWGNVSFANTDFGNGNVNFINCSFGGKKVSFKVCRFGEGVFDFHFSSFHRTFLSFELVDFGNGLVNFSRVNFGVGKVNFNRSRFGQGEIVFDGAMLLNGKFTIRWVDFGNGNINFENIEMHGTTMNLDKARFDKFGTSNISFNRADIETLSLRSCHLDDYFDLRVKKADYINLSNTVVRDIIDLKTYDYNVEIRVLDIAHIRLLGIIDIDWVKNNVKELIYRQEGKQHWEVAEQFRVLKENFNRTGRYTDEDKAYVEFKRVEQKALLSDRIKINPLNRFVEYPYFWFKRLIFDKVGLYATSPIRVIFSMLFFYIGFSAVYLFGSLFHLGSIECAQGSVNEGLPMVVKSLYFSAVTFFTIGYGDFYPMGSLKFFAAFEGFIGLFMMAYFTVAFVRKILR